MPYHYLEDIGTADIAFEATGRDLSELFRDAADATMNVMIDNIDAIQPRETRHIELSSDRKANQLRFATLGVSQPSNSRISLSFHLLLILDFFTRSLCASTPPHQ